MSDYSFDFNVADATLYDMNAVNNRVRSSLDEMQKAVESSLSEWTGEAQNAYWAAKAEWNRQAAQMPEALNQARQTLANIGDNYGMTEKQAQSLWNNVRGG